MARLDSSLDTLKKLKDSSHQVRQKFEPHWFINIAFFNGQQWAYWNNGRVDFPKLPKHRLLVTDNRIMPVIQTRIAKKTKQRPIWTAVPNSPDDEDISAALLGEIAMTDA